MDELLKFIAGLSVDEIDEINYALIHILPNCSVFVDVANALDKLDDDWSKEVAERLRSSKLSPEAESLIGALWSHTDTALWPGVGSQRMPDGSWKIIE